MKNDPIVYNPQRCRDIAALFARTGADETQVFGGPEGGVFRSPKATFIQVWVAVPNEEIEREL